MQQPGGSVFCFRPRYYAPAGAGSRASRAACNQVPTRERIAVVGVSSVRKALGGYVRWMRRPVARRGAAPLATEGEGNAEVLTAVESAKDAVELGLKTLSETGDAQRALELFERAQELRPNKEEAAAATYNAACCLAKLGKWEEAANGIVEAVNRLDVKIKVALEVSL